MNRYTLHNDDNMNVLRAMPDNSVDSIVTDPPYGLSFMGKKWDYDVPSVELWTECLRVLKPGGHLLAFAGTRTQHRMAVRIEDAGFEIRDMICWLYASGFPKSLDVSKAIDKAAGAEREVVGRRTSAYGTETATKERVSRDKGGAGLWKGGEPKEVPLTGGPATEAARRWEGWGTALKPAMEPITVARKPFDVTVAENVLTHGTGALNIDGCRVPTAENTGRPCGTHGFQATTGGFTQSGELVTEGSPLGRWPANLIHDGSEEVVELFPESSVTGKRTRKSKSATVHGTNWLSDNHESIEYTDSGSAARFFYCAKASRTDRHSGMEDPGSQFQHGATLRKVENTDTTGNNHPTVKPTQLMQYLCRLVTPPNGIVLDPFMGSGSTGKAALLEGFQFIGIEREPEYMAIAERRIAHVSPEPSMPSNVKTDIEPVKREQTDKGQLSLFGGK